jgi:hypothetical protein
LPKDKKAGQVMHLTDLFVVLSLQTGLLLNLRFSLYLSSCRWAARFLGSFLLEQGQGIRSVERVFAEGSLPSATQRDVHAAIARQEDRL